jgi:hypothetical protein
MGKEITTLRRCGRRFWSRRRTQNNGKEELCVSLSLFFSLSLSATTNENMITTILSLI